VLADFVTVEEGTGLVHQAPAYGADDMQVANDNDLPILMTVDTGWHFIPEVRNWAGRFVKDADPYIIEDLNSRGLLFRKLDYTHTYPFCWRCHTPLLYYARPTWYIRTSALKDKLVSLNQEVNWYPSHIKMDVSATGWRTISTGLWAVNAIGAHRCRSGSARAATIRNALDR
jgi:isoleucyl-tRNA synthetase